MEKNIQEKLRRHDAFWRGEMTERPMIGFQVGSYFMAQGKKMMEYARELGAKKR